MELLKGVHLLLLEQHVELVQGFLPLPQEGAGTMLQLPEPLQEKLRSRHPVWQPTATLQVREGSSQGQSPCRMPESLLARVAPPQPAPAQGVMTPPKSWGLVGKCRQHGDHHPRITVQLQALPAPPACAQDPGSPCLCRDSPGTF